MIFQLIKKREREKKRDSEREKCLGYRDGS